MEETAKEETGPAAERAIVKLYKVLTLEGHAPFVPAYRWSLPIQSADGSWTPGDWHEETPQALCVRGLHVTAFPGGWGSDRASNIVCEAECEGIAGDPALDDKVLAARVRLLRVLSDAETDVVNEAWCAAKDERELAREAEQRQEWVDREKAEQKERLDAARKVAISAKKDVAAARAAGVASPALFAFRTLIALTPTDSWVDVNGSRRDAMEYVVARLRMDPDDVGTICKDFGGSYWLNAESLYSHAIEAGNASACVALEKFLGRKPWWRADHKGGRERLHVGSTIRLDDAWHTVTSFRDEYLNAKRESGAKVYRITRDMLAGKGASALGTEA